MKTQLFNAFPAKIPYAVEHARGQNRVMYQTIATFPFTHWTNGQPCVAINMYFLDIAHTTTGGTLKTYASQLTHLIRYCEQHDVAFRNFDDDHLFSLSKSLQSEFSSRYTGERARNNNTIRDILARCISFFLWYQGTLIRDDQVPLICEKKSGRLLGKINVERRRLPTKAQRRSEATYLWHPAMPEPEIRSPKHPIGQPAIEAIEMAIEARAESELFRLRHVKMTEERRKYKICEIEYLRKRRHFILWLMKRTGLRPGEMIGINPATLSNIRRERELKIPTLKRRRNRAILRIFPIQLADSLIVSRYLLARADFIDTARPNGPGALPGSLFLGRLGQPISKSSLERDFHRIVKFAGFESHEACYSMFRHRFITIELIIHFKEFMAKTEKGRYLMTDSDYRSILKRIASKTGHGSPESLWHYIDIAWSEMDVWGNVDRSIARLNAADRLFEEILELKHEIELPGHQPVDSLTLASTISERLGLIVSDAKNAGIPAVN